MRFYKKYHTFLYFYSRPCGRGDGVGKARQMDGRISTHAPAGGATRSIRARTGRTKQFLLTPLREGRLVNLYIVRRLPQLISTHAPAGGATSCQIHP